MKLAKKQDLILNFKDLTRQPTGIHFLDSGGATGRVWQQPHSPDECYFDLFHNNEFSGSIPLASFLDATLQIDEDLTRELYGPEYESLEVISSCDEDTIKIVEALTGLQYIDTVNTYNYDTDLDQVMQYAIFSDSDDWYFSENTVLLLETHNGADIRGGYSQCVVARFQDIPEDTGFLNTQCDLVCLSDASQDIYDLVDQHSNGYGLSIWQFAENHVAEIVATKADKTELTVKLKTGEVVSIGLTCRAFLG